VRLSKSEFYPINRESWAKSLTHRLSFFTKAFSSIGDLDDITDNEFIGYAIVKNDTLPSGGGCLRVYESVVRLSRHPNNIARGTQRWDCTVAGHSFRVIGYLYAQQNNMTNVCAHVALRSAAARFHPSGDMSYGEMNSLVGIDHIKKKAGGKDGEGLTPSEMVTILEKAGATCFVGDFTIPVSGSITLPFQKYVYGSVESGFPAIVMFGTTDTPVSYHVVPAFGHTFNEDTWVHKADSSYFGIGSDMVYIPSESWVSMYLAHDDNWGSNFCIPRRYLHVRPYCNKASSETKVCQMESECVVYVIGTAPKEVKLSPIRAEVIGFDYLLAILPNVPDDNTNLWCRRLYKYVLDQQVVIRPILIESSEYPAHLRKLHDWDGNPVSGDLVLELENLIGRGKFEEKLWMIEFSIPELFSANRRKVAELLLRAEVTPGAKRDFRNFVIARFPGYFVHCKNPDPDNPEFSFTRTNVQSHVQLFGCEGESF